MARGFVAVTARTIHGRYLMRPSDGGGANKNPTWTILALSMRASEYLAEERRQGNI